MNPGCGDVLCLLEMRMATRGPWNTHTNSMLVILAILSEPSKNIRFFVSVNITCRVSVIFGSP